MQFKTEQAQVAHLEILGEIGKCTERMQQETKKLIALHPNDSIMISIHMSSLISKMQVDSLAEAIKTANQIDIQWGDLKAHLMMCSSK